MSLQFPKITVITPSYNQGGYIEQTIQSVLSQNYPNLEYLVVDGGSTDETLAVLGKYKDRLQWISERDRGQSDALNKGFRAATGDIIAFINSDDRYEPEALHAVGRFFTQNPDCSWVTGMCRNIDPQGREIRKTITQYKNVWLQFRSYKILQILNYISQPATFWRRRVFESVGGVDENRHYAMDYDYWIRIGQVYRLGFINQYLASFRIHPGSKAGSSATAQFDAEMEIIRSHVRSPMVLGLHRLHRFLTVCIYKQLLSKEHRKVLSAPNT